MRRSSRQQSSGEIAVKEFTAFFETMCDSSDGWPGLSDQQLAEYLAAALINMGKKRGLGVALAETFAHEVLDTTFRHNPSSAG